MLSMPSDFVIARNPDGDSQLPYLLRIPLGDEGLVVKARDTWPRTAKVYCHRVEEWPVDAEVVEVVPTRSCVRRGAAIDLVLDRARENRSQLVLTRIQGGREAIFWQTARTARQSRPGLALPRQRASGQHELEITVDTRERYAYDFADRQARVVRAALPAGDYGLVVGDRLVAAVERKSLADLVGSLTGGRLKYQLAELASLPHAALVVEDRYASVFKLRQVRPAVVAEGIAECQVRWPQVPIIFCDSRRLAQEWTFRFLGAARAALGEDREGADYLGAALPSGASTEAATSPGLSGSDLVSGSDPAESAVVVTPAAPATAEVRAWARAQGVEISAKGRIPQRVLAAYAEAHAGSA